MEDRLLVLSIRSLQQRSLEVDELTFREFCRFYLEVKLVLERYITETHSRFIEERLREMPVIREEDEEYWIERIPTLFGVSFNFFRSVLKNERLDSELTALRGICDSIIAVLSTPGLEGMYYNKEKSE